MFWWVRSGKSEEKLRLEIVLVEVEEMALTSYQSFFVF